MDKKLTNTRKAFRVLLMAVAYLAMFIMGANRTILSWIKN